MAKKPNSVGYWSAYLTSLLEGVQSGYGYNTLRMVLNRVQRLPKSGSSFLFPELQVAVEQNSNASQQRQASAAVGKRQAQSKSPSSKRRESRKVEGRKASGQGWLHLDMDADTFQFRLSRVHPRASLSDGATLRQNIRPFGSGTPQGPQQAKQLNKELGVTQ